MISLICFRFEIEDGQLIPYNLCYTGPSRAMQQSCDGNHDTSGNVSADHGMPTRQDNEYESTATDRTTKPSDSSAQGRKGNVGSHRGKRTAKQLQIETFAVKDNAEGDASIAAASIKGNDANLIRESNSDISFFSGNPTVEVTKGIIHIYKENQMTSLDDNASRSEMLCMLAVPATMSCNDLIQFAAPYSPNIQHIKIIRDSTPNEYMVLIKFKNQTFADEFFKLYNGRTYHSLEDKICHLVYVSFVETMISSQGASFPVSGLTELPNCPVCLERMDESVDGVLTILCNHSFHTNCLTQWGDSSCPVCRYCQSPEIETASLCLECDAQNDLWICMICGNIGCGRYSAGHAYSHFQVTEHAYAMELDNHRVWDYTSDNYVHRLVQNKSDGKPVAISNNDVFADDEDKRDSLALEFTYLLTQQLESQRRYYESKILSLEDEAAKKLSLREEDIQKLQNSMSSIEQELTTTKQQRQNLENKSHSLGNRVKKLTKELDEEKEMNKCMRDNQVQLVDRLDSSNNNWKSKEEELLKKISDLEDQLRDVMFYLDAQKKVSQSPAEAQKDIQDGNISLGAASSSPSSCTAHSRKTRKKKK